MAAVMNARALTFRTARLDDPAESAALLSLINRAFAVEKGDFKVAERLTPEELADYGGRGTFLLAEQAGALAACAFVEPRGLEGYLGLLSVDPALQRRGVGRAMTDEAERWLAERGCCSVVLDTLDRRPELRTIYEGMGYAVVSITPAPCPERFTKPVQFVRMRKALPVASTVASPVATEVQL